MSPFAGYRDFQTCVNQNRDKRNPDAYCGSIKHEIEDKAMPKKRPPATAIPRPGYGPPITGKPKPDFKIQKAVDSASYLHQSVRAAITVVVKGHDPVKEEGKKKLTANDGTANEGSQDDQPFAVAFGPDNYDKLVKRIIKAPYQEAYNAAGAVLKALENKQFNFPGNIEEHMKKAHAAIHGREMWDARYGDVCELITRARKILHSIEKTAEVSQGGSGMMVVGKADPGQSERRPGSPGSGRPPGHQPPAPDPDVITQPSKPPPHPSRVTPTGADHVTGVQPRRKMRRARKAVKPDSPFTTGQPIPGGGSAKKPGKRGPTRADTVSFPRRKPQAYKAVQKAIKAVRGR